MSQAPLLSMPPANPTFLGEKIPETPTTTVSELKTPKSPKEEQASPTMIQGALPDILYGAFLPCVPIVLITTLLLTLIFYHRVDLDEGWELLRVPAAKNVSEGWFLDRTLQLKLTGGNAAYYVRLNPAILAAIAAWTSKITPFLTSSSMAVIAFFAGRRILDATRNNRTSQLPTPHQMSILINLLNGAGAGPLWDTIAYRWQNHERLVQPIPLAFGALSYVVIITLLIGAADTWFAAATKPMNFELIRKRLSPINTYGRNLNPDMCGDSIWEKRPCPSDSTLLCDYPCSIEDWNFTTGGSASLKEGIKGAQESAETLLSNSFINIIQNTSYYTDDHSYGAEQYYFLGDIATGPVLDFLANTTAVATQCEVVSKDCEISSTDEGFSCYGYQPPSLTYSGEVGVDPEDAMAPGNMSMSGIQFFKDANLQDPIGFGRQSTELFGAQNPIHFLTWSKGFPPIDTSSTTFDEMRIGKHLQVDHSGDNVFILNCTTTIYKTVYAWVNGTILQNDTSHSFYPTLAPSTYGAIFSAPFAINSALGHLALQDAAALAAYKTTPQEVAEKFADEFSRAAVALTAGIMAPATNLLEQSRNNTELLTRVPKIPLYFLVGLKTLYALASLIVAGLAVLLTGPAEAQEVKARLTVDGLAAVLFEPGVNQEKAVKRIEELYGEHRPKGSGAAKEELEEEEEGKTKVGMKQTDEGGWVWVASGKCQKAWKNLGLGDLVSTVVGVAADSGELGKVGREYAVLRKIM